MGGSTKMLTPPYLPDIILMNGKENHQTTNQPSKALAKAKASRGSMHPMRRGTTTHKKPRRKVRGNPARIHEEANRCENSLQVFSELSEVRRRAVQVLLCHRRIIFWRKESGLAAMRLNHEALLRCIQRLSAWQELCLRLSTAQASQLIHLNETNKKHWGRPVSYSRNLQATWKAEGRTKKARIGLCPACDR